MLLHSYYLHFFIEIIAFERSLDGKFSSKYKKSTENKRNIPKNCDWLPWKRFVTRSTIFLVDNLESHGNYKTIKALLKTILDPFYK